MNQPDLTELAALAGEPARAMMLAALFDGRALSAGELARAAGISPATASAHLSKLLGGGFVRARAQGRHRYYEIARPEIAGALETLGSLGKPRPIRSLAESLRMRPLRFARSCYSHLAGELAVEIAQALVRCGALEIDEDGFRATECARSIFLPMGVDTSTVLRRPDAHIRACVDWTERRPHISGPLGADLLQALLASGALRRRAEPRVLDLTPAGRDLLMRVFGLDFTDLRRKLDEAVI